MARGGAKGKILHTVALVHGKKPFEEWKTVTPKIQLLKRLAPRIYPHVNLPVCISVPVSDFDALWRTQELGIKRREQMNPTLFCLQTCMEQIVERVKPSANKPVVCIFEQNPPKDPDIMRYFYYLREAQGWTQLFSDIRFLPKGPAPLQAADLIAYCENDYAREQLRGHPPQRYNALDQCLRQLRASFTTSPKSRFKIANRSELAELASGMCRIRDHLKQHAALGNAVNQMFDEAHARMQRERNRRALPLAK